MGFSFKKLLGGAAAVVNPVGLLGTGLAIGGDIYSASKEAQSVKDINAMNQRTAREQMQFQERMSNTAHQREVADLKAAGLNPLLSANSGASTPSGASWEAQPVPSVASRTLSSAMDQIKTASDIKSMIATTRSQSARAGLDEFELNRAREHPDEYLATKYGTGDLFSAKAFSAFMHWLRGNDHGDDHKVPSIIRHPVKTLEKTRQKQMDELGDIKGEPGSNEDEIDFKHSITGNYLRKLLRKLRK